MSAAAVPLLAVEGVQVHFPQGGGLFRRAQVLRAVEDVSFDVAPGEALALVGESGSGKSTLGNVVAGLRPPTAGRVRFDGRPPDAASRRAIQVVFQDPYGALDPRMTVAQIIAEPLRIQRTGTAAARRERAAALVAQVGLPRDALNRYPHEFSGGQRQRIAIARALAPSPRLIVADEPLSSLDVSIQSGILNLLRGLQGEHGLAYLFISHDLAVVHHIANRVAVLYLGRLVEVAARDALFARPAHPYTQALLDAVPRIGRRRVRGAALRGEMPSPLSPPPGLRVPPALPEGGGGVPDGGPGAADAGAGSGHGVPLPVVGRHGLPVSWAMAVSGGFGLQDRLEGVRAGNAGCLAQRGGGCHAAGLPFWRPLDRRVAAHLAMTKVGGAGGHRAGSATARGMVRVAMVPWRETLVLAPFLTQTPPQEDGTEPMTGFVLRRALQTLVVLLVMSFVIYGLIGLMPGDPIDVMMASNPGMTPEAAARLRTIYGLDQPLLFRYAHWLQAAVGGDLGYSRVHARPVLEVMGPALWQTTKLMLGGFTLAVVLALALGTLAALRPGGWLDGVISVAALAGVSVPVFWLALIFILVFAQTLHWLPAGGVSTVGEEGWRDTMRHLLLPVLTLALSTAGQFVRYVRAAMVDVLRMDHIRTARAKGAGEARVVRAHALRNAMIPVVTVVALSFGTLFGGALITETMFAQPGLGKMIYDSILGNDFNLALAGLLFATLVTLGSNLAADLAYSWLDPRISLA